MDKCKTEEMVRIRSGYIYSTKKMEAMKWANVGKLKGHRINLSLEYIAFQHNISRGIYWNKIIIQFEIKLLATNYVMLISNSLPVKWFWKSACQFALPT